MNTTTFKSMSIDKLVNLRDQVDAILTAKIDEERRAVQERLGKLSRLGKGGNPGAGARGGARGTVAPKYRNPENPVETWAGRGLKPRWLAAALKSGKKLEDFSIMAAAKKPRSAAAKSARKSPAKRTRAR